MKLSQSILVLSLLVLFTGAAAAQDDPCAGLDGNAYGLCNAYCEAMDCDSPNQPASERACERKFQQFQLLTGEVPPCEGVTCPCIDDQYPIFTSFADGSRLITGCSVDDTPGDSMVMTIDSSLASATVTIVDGEVPTCAAADSPDFETLMITKEQAMECGALLVIAAEADLGAGACGM